MAVSACIERRLVFKRYDAPAPTSEPSMETVTVIATARQVRGIRP